MSYDSSLFPINDSVGIIAPFWADIDLRKAPDVNVGHIYYQCFMRASADTPLPANQQHMFDNVTRIILNTYGDNSFQASMVCVFTWENVHPFPDYNTQGQVRKLRKQLLFVRNAYVPFKLVG